MPTVVFYSVGAILIESFILRVYPTTESKQLWQMWQFYSFSNIRRGELLT